jgi:hypothetical protein
MAATNVGYGSKAEILTASTCCPLYPRKQTFACDLGKSAWCQKATFAPSAFVQAARQHRERNAGTLISAPVNRNSYSRLSAGPPEW